MADMINSAFVVMDSPAECMDSCENSIRYLGYGEFYIYKVEGVYWLTLPDECTHLNVSAHLTHPTSFPEQYISLRSESVEIGIVRDLNYLDTSAQSVIREMLEKRYYIPRITKIINVKELCSGLAWQVETDKGPKKLITRDIHQSVWQVSYGRYFLLDNDNLKYEILTADLPRKNAAWLERML